MKKLRILANGSDKLVETCKEYVKIVFEYGSDTWDEHYVFEAAIEAVFGEEQAKWIWENIDECVDEPIEIIEFI